MQNMQRVGAYAALIQGLLILIAGVMFGVVLPSQGFLAQSDFSDFAKVVPVIPSFNVVNMVAVLRSFVFLLVILAVSERIQAAAPNRMRLAVIGASIACTLLLAQGMMNFIGWHILLQNPSSAATAGAAVQAISQSLIDSATFAEGWTSVLFGWAALTSKTFSAPLSGIVILSGVLSLLAPFFEIMLPPALLLWIVWSFWLGIALLQGVRAPVSGTAGTAKA